jgi:hypothetical protein
VAYAFAILPNRVHSYSSSVLRVRTYVYLFIVAYRMYREEENVFSRGRLCHVVYIRKRICSRLFVYDRVYLCVLVILIRSIACFPLSGIVSNRLMVEVRRAS